jgi:enamine deaminase RidA (YjgF/YER057c/UK114 family)
MEMETRRGFVGKIAAIAAVMSGAARMVAGQTPAAPNAGAAQAPGAGGEKRSNHIHQGIYYFSGTGANDGYPKEDHVTPADPFDKHVTRTMDALKKSLERNGSTMDDILHLTVFFRVPPAGVSVVPAASDKTDIHRDQYDALNKIYGTYFSQGKAPSRACMAVEWIPGDSLIEVVGSAKVVNG